MKSSVEKWLELIEADEELSSKLLQEKSKYEATQDGLECFLKKDFIPLAKKYGFEFSVDDVLKCSDANMQELSDDVVGAVAGGKKNSVLGLGLVSLILLSSLPVGSLLLKQDDEIADSSVSMNVSEKTQKHEKLRKSTSNKKSDLEDETDDGSVKSEKNEQSKSVDKLEK